MKYAIRSILVIIIVLILFVVPFEREVVLEPLVARDSDGKISSDIMTSQEDFSYVLLLKTFPFAFLEMEWENENMKEVKIVTEWRTNEFGAGNIYIGYFSDGEWKEVGPFQSSNFTTTVIDVPVGDKIKYRFRGEDTDFGVDAIAWIKVNALAKQSTSGLLS